MDGAGKQRPVSLTENQFVLLRADTDPKKTMLGRFYGEKVTALRFGSVRPFGVKPRSVGQQFLQEALLLPAEEVPLAIIQGPAGTAKTFYALAAGLEQVLETEERPYRKILVCRPNAQFDADIGFLPGSEQEKISPPHAAHCGQFGNSAGSGGEEKGAASAPRPWSCVLSASCAPSWPSWPPPPWPWA